MRFKNAQLDRFDFEWDLELVRSSDPAYARVTEGDVYEAAVVATEQLSTLSRDEIDDLVREYDARLLTRDASARVLAVLQEAWSKSRCKGGFEQRRRELGGACEGETTRQVGDIALIIKTLREAAGYRTITEAAKASGVPSQVLAAIEDPADPRMPHPWEWARLASKYCAGATRSILREEFSLVEPEALAQALALIGD